ncbi:MAG: translocation/assembly module TamB [Chryseobacterium sp.]|nr:MAG: translocation/assembly module TamB [Chryseobacterium sp.]
MAKINNNQNKEEKGKSLGRQVTDAVGKAAGQVGKTAQQGMDFAEEVGEQIQKDVTSYTWWAKLLLILFYGGLGLIGLFFLALNLPATKRYLAGQALKIVNSDFQAQMKTEDIEVNIFGDVIVHNLEIKDHHGLNFLTAEEFQANTDWFSIIKSPDDINFHKLTFHRLDLKVITYKGEDQDNFTLYLDKFSSDKKKKEGVFHLNTRVDIIDSKVSIHNRNHPGDEGKWLTAENVNLRVPVLKVEGADVTGRINNLTFTTYRRGKSHFVDTFSADVALTHKLLSVKGLTFNTDSSLLMGDIVFNLDPQTGWSDFTDKVAWDMHLKPGSLISGKDLNYFMADWDNNAPVSVSGDMHGPLNNFTLRNFLIRSKDVNLRTPSANFRDLLKGGFQIRTNLISTDLTYQGLKAILPRFITKKMGDFPEVFSRIKYNGAASVNPNAIVAKGNLITGIGQAVADITLTDYSSDWPRYRGTVDVKDLNVTALTENKQVGLITGHIVLDGRGLDVNTMSVRTRSDISRIELLGKPVHNVVVNGEMIRRRFDGTVKVRDAEIAGDVSGIIDFSTPRIFADIRSNIDHFNLNYFGLKSGEAVSVAGGFDGKISFSDINDLNLDARLENLSYKTGKQRYNIPDAAVKAFLQNNQRIVSLDAPGVVQGEISGYFNLGDLAAMVENGINGALAGYRPTRIYKGQNFSFDFNVQQQLVNLLLDDVRIPRGARISGNYSGTGNDLVLDADVPYLKYMMLKQEEITEADRALARSNPDYSLSNIAVTRDSIMADSVRLQINTALPNEQLALRFSRAQYGTNLIKNFRVDGEKDDADVLHLKSRFLMGSDDDEFDESLGNYAINLSQKTAANGDIELRFEPTQVSVNRFTWTVDTSPERDHSIVYHRAHKDIEINNLRLFSGESELFIDGLFRDGKDFRANLEVRSLDLAKVLSLRPGDSGTDIRGVANGTASLVMSENNLEPVVDMRIDNIVINGEEIGNLFVTAKNSENKNIFDLTARIESGESGIIGNNKLMLHGTINNNTASPTLDITSELKDFNMAFAGQFVREVFSNVRGKATGEVRINGPLRDLNYSGDINMRGLGFKLNFTGVDYSFEDTVIPVSRGFVQLNNLVMRDGRNNSGGTVSGAIQFETLSSMGVNLIVRSDNLMLLNTTQKDFDTFWGRVYARGDIFISGPVTSLNIDADAAVLSGSEFTLNSSSTSSVEEFKMLRFLEVDDAGQVIVAKRERSGANMNINLTLDIDRNSTVNVLVGEDVGDISVRGAADNLRFSMKRSGQMSMTGSYFVDNGTFVSKAILERTFQIRKGSNIAWDGDVLDPTLDITADYFRLVSNAGEYLNVGQLQPLNVQLQTRITQNMKNPKVSFDIMVPDASSQIREALAFKMTTEDEKIKQFGSVLALSSFNTSGTDIIGTSLATTGYNVLFKQLAGVFNTISNDFQVDLDYIRGDQASNSGDRANTSVSFVLSPRVTVKTGLGVPITRTADTRNDYLSGEGIIEYDMSRRNDGSLVARVYSKPANIGLVMGTNANANQTYGAGVAYSRSFQRIFGKRTKKASRRKREVLPPQPAPAADSVNN